MHVVYFTISTLRSLESFFQDSSSLAKLPSGCSKLKYLPASRASKHFSADKSAIEVSDSSLDLCFLFILSSSPGIPLGWSKERSGRWALEAPWMGISRALLKVAQFGAKCANNASNNLESKNSASRKTSKPRSKSQGASTVQRSEEETERGERQEQTRGESKTSTLRHNQQGPFLRKIGR